jgi:uncharacterized oligopeptide transporter (OPT) family protein
MIPAFVSIGWLQEGEPFRKITFLIALGLIMGAAIVDLAVIFWEAARRARGAKAPAAETADWKRVNTLRLVLWVAFWAAGIVLTGHLVLGQPVTYIAFAVGLVFVFAMVNGISLGISDSNPISSAFVVSVVIMATFGLSDPVVGLMAGTVLLVSTSVACDMQQDRSTGWRLGTNRVFQFRYQVVGIFVGALLAVGFARLFMTAYPVLLLDQTVMKAGEQPAEWSAAMTYKFVGVLRSLTDDKPYQRTAIWLGVGLGFAFALARKLVKENAAYRRFVASGRKGFVTDFLVDAVFLPSPYASSFGGFVNLHTSIWFAAGGIISSALNSLPKPKPRPGAPEVPADMSTTSLVGGGLIAGDALAALGIGLFGLGSALLAG